MGQFIALLRGINVGGNNRLPMADLRRLCEDLGWGNVRTYIASGNVVFEADGGAEALASALHAALPFDAQVLVMGEDDFRTRMTHCPFPPNHGKLAHGFFCLDRPTLDADVIAQFRTTEVVIQEDHTVWLHTPDGFSKSKLAEVMDRVITETAFTARNLNTVHKLAEMLDKG